jgi:hypothetical protein
MTGAGDGGVARLRAELAAAGEQIGRARRALARGRPSALERLPSLIEGLEGRLESAPRALRDDLRPELLALLDEAAGLAAALGVEMRDLGLRLRAEGERRRAEIAYRGPPGERQRDHGGD